MSYIFGQLRSDYASFVARRCRRSSSPTATGGCYHTTGDDLEIVDFDKLRAQSKIAFRTVVELAERAERPKFVAPSLLATYDDAVALSSTLQSALLDVALFSTKDQVLMKMLGAGVQNVVAAGPESFGVVGVGVVLAAAGQTLSALEQGGCRRFRGSS